jgi:RimJ/RimL family protein N-acetyltransferase
MADAAAILALAICADDRLVGGMSLVPATRRPGFREISFWLSRPSWGQGATARLATKKRVDTESPNPYTRG